MTADVNFVALETSCGPERVERFRRLRATTLSLVVVGDTPGELKPEEPLVVMRLDPPHDAPGEGPAGLMPGQIADMSLPVQPLPPVSAPPRPLEIAADEEVVIPSLRPDAETGWTVPRKREEVQPPVALREGTFGVDPQVRQLCRQIREEMSEIQRPTLVCSSPEPGGDQTSLVAQLGAALAEAVEGEVLLVDAQGPASRLTGLFALEGKPGLREVVAGHTDWTEAVQPTATCNLSVLPCGQLAAAALNSSGNMTWPELIQQWRLTYHAVLIDGPGPRHPALHNIAKHTDGLYLVARCGETCRESIYEAALDLKECGISPHGCLLTAAADA